MRLRTVWVALFALAGGLLGVTVMPSGLNALYRAIHDANERQDAGTVRASTDTLVFERFVLNGETDVATVVKRIEGGFVSFAGLAKETGLKGDLPEVTMSREKLTLHAEYLPLRGVTPGKPYAAVAADPETQGPTLYRLVRTETTQAAPTEPEVPEYPGTRLPHVVIALGLLGAIVGMLFGGATFRFGEYVGSTWERMAIGERVNLFVGVVVGIVCSFPFLVAFSSLGQVVAPLLTLGLTIGFSALAIFALKSMEDVLPWQASAGPRRRGIKVLDTNVLIDGRVADVIRSGFLEGEIYVPGFVLRELQHIADAADSLRRQRGRRGLEVLKALQADKQIEVGGKDRLAGEEKDDVDGRLVRLAKAMGADLVSNDYNLNRVATIQNVVVLNLNDLALAMRTNVLPGETLHLQVIREGNQSGQGVGYLEDGTMVVIDGGEAHIGETIDIVVSQVIQTERGKMVFGAPGDEVPENDPRRRPAPRKQGR